MVKVILVFIHENNYIALFIRITVYNLCKEAANSDAHYHSYYNIIKSSKLTHCNLRCIAATKLGLLEETAQIYTAKIESHFMLMAR